MTLKGEALIWFGGALVLTAFAGKKGISFYRGVLNKTAFQSGPMTIGRYHSGGFEDKMTRREAALILGIRETAEEKKILEAHKKLMVLNHPDAGGSTYVATKVNEAKELLVGGSST